MMVSGYVKGNFDPYAVKTGCTKAEHIVALQAEKDCRPLVPYSSGKLKESGKVEGNVISWTTPYARVVYFGNVYIDPKYKKGGFPYKQGMFRSRPGVEKVSSGKKFNIVRGESGWFYDARKKCVGRWLRIAQEVVTSEQYATVHRN